MAEKHIQIRATDEKRLGAYANMMQVRHLQEEFTLDFFFVSGEEGQLAARVVVSPAHAKRIIRALQENMKRYEDSYGPVQGLEDPEGGIGFAP